MKTTIYMVRHAEAPFVFGEERTRGLSAKGVEDAKRVASLLASVDVHEMVSSPYARAKMTIQYAAEQKNLDIVEYEELAERAILGLDREAPWDVLVEAIRRSFTDKEFALEGGESTRQAQRRTIPVIEKLLERHRGRTIVIGTHGNIMTIILNHYDERFGFDFWKSTSMPDIYKLTFDGSRLESVERRWS
ncbi:histidine phosphatase family protein [Paenibacillus flagellatus]|uniref:Histidine phosphatase family protein n=1 Tax=Paenibacillus flagellatus TaxID=2211139 RepID=A0A2V5K428_9BACL|nr:histidine phosphatase family protein [Paenibacillus flagellatus]PYI53432.1 histidine phosphatase family protein [Paenibacillus flagellatus]